MGNMSSPGSVVVSEIDHAPFTVHGEVYFVRELRWNDTDGRSYDVHRRSDAELMNDGYVTESFDDYPTPEQITERIAGYHSETERDAFDTIDHPKFSAGEQIYFIRQRRRADAAEWSVDLYRLHAGEGAHEDVITEWFDENPTSEEIADWAAGYSHARVPSGD